MTISAIQIHSYDNVGSIQDQLSWSKSQRIILVWPKQGIILTSELDLFRLDRVARNLGKQIILVTHHPSIIEWAESKRIPHYASIAAAESASFDNLKITPFSGKKLNGSGRFIRDRQLLKSKIRKTESRKLEKTISVFLCVIALVLLVFSIVPSAEIIYYPEITLQQVELDIRASEQFTSPNPSGSIPARFQYSEVDGELSQPSSGTTRIPSTKASGIVQFENLTLLPVTIPVGTILKTADLDGPSYILIDQVVIPASSVQMSEGQVEAILAGSSGNLNPNEISLVLGDIGSLVKVTNPEPISGGSDIEAPSPSEKDYAQLRAILIEQLKVKALAEINNLNFESQKAILESMVVDEIQEELLINPVGEPADQAKLQLKIKFKVLTYDENDLNSIALLVLNSNNSEGLEPINDVINIEKISGIQMNDTEQATWTIQVSRELVPYWNQDAIAKRISGMSVEKAYQIMQNAFVQTKPAVIHTWLGIWHRLPFLPMRINFINGMNS